MRISLLMIFIFIAIKTHASLVIPRSMTASDQRAALSVFGFGSSFRMLSSPLPLGGESGYEIGISQNAFATSNLVGVGNQTRRPSDIALYSITLGKGLFYDIDTFVTFTPLQQEENISSYGFMLRWSILNDPKNLPVILTATLQGTGSNFGNLIAVQTTGFDLIAGIRSEEMTFYFGGGQLRTSGTFIGGSGGVTATSNTEQADLSESHTMFGVNFDLSNYFIAGQIDRYDTSIYSIKLGTRF